jgi:predicted ATPase
MAHEQRGQGGLSHDRPAFHELLLRYRTAANESLQEFAEALRVSPKAVQTYERHPQHPSARTPPTEVFRRLCAHLREKGVLQGGEYAAFAAAWSARRRDRRVLKASPPAASASSDDAAVLFRQLLPRRLTALVGRDSLVDGLCALLQQPNVALVTLVGAGGIGKTRVALEVARRLRPIFPHGAFFIELAAVAEPDAVAGTIATHLGVREPRAWDPRDRLIAWLLDKQALLVLDSFEHLIAAAPLVSDLLARCEGINILVTSRTALQLYGEHVRDVPPLDPTAAQELFIQRVRDVQADFTNTAETRAAIDAICRRLDRLPLAIELAARRLKKYGTVQALRHALMPSLPELIEGPRDVPARQQTMRATIAWSYQLLDAHQQWLFRQLAVCRGGCSLAAVRALGEERVDVDAWLDGLLEQGMLNRTPEMAASAEDARVWMFEVVREFGLEQLAATGEWEAARQRHAAYYVRLAEEADSHMFGPRQGRWLRRLDQDYDNMRAALEGAIMAGDGETALRLASALWHYWERRGYVPEGRRWLDRAFTVAANASLPVRARARYVAARLATLQADYSVAERWHEESRALAEEIGDQRLLGNLLNSWGGLAHGQEQYGRAIQFHTEALALFRALGDREGMGDAYYNIGLAYVLQWDPIQAEPYYEQASALFKKIGDRRGYALARLGVGITRTMLGDWPAALAAYRQSLILARRMHDTDLLTYVVHGIAGVIGLQGDTERSARLFGAAARMREEVAVALPPSYRALVETTIARIKAGMASPETFERYYQEGQALSMTQTLGLARQYAAVKRT